MNDWHIAITGPTSGIGRSSSITLAKMGARLSLLCRNLDKAAELQREILAKTGHQANIVELDMASLASVRRAAEELLEQGQPLDVLLNNAGVVNLKRKETVDGYEETLAVNHFAPFLLTGMLLPLLHEGGGGRIVNVASNAHAFVRSMRFEDMQAERNYSVFREYGRSKLANILFTRSLARRLRGTNLTVNTLHPGAVATALGKNNPGAISSLLPLLLRPFFLSPEQGAATSIYLCSSDDVAEVSGKYFIKSKIATPRAWAQDDEAAERLWQFTERCVDFCYNVQGISGPDAAHTE